MTYASLKFSEPDHSYTIEGRKALGCTSVLKDLGHYPNYDPNNTGPRDFGTAVHKASALMIQDKLDKAGTSPVLVPYIEGLEEKAREMKMRLIASEMPVFNGYLHVAGTLDLLTYIYDDEVALFDLKSGSSVPRAVELQTACYEGCLRWMWSNRCMPSHLRTWKMPSKIRRFSMHLQPGRAIVKECSRDLDHAAWVAQVTTWSWKFGKD